MNDRSGAERLGFLEGLRGIAIAVVVWYHLRIVSGFVVPGTDLFARAGFLGVDLFFFVSGFCIAYPYVRAGSQGLPPPRLGEYIRRRALKIVPSYVLALVVFGVIYRARFASFGDEFAQLLAHLGFIHVWFPATFGSFSGPLWTLGVEVQFYVVFALLAPAFVRRPMTTYLILVALSVTYRVTLGLTGLDTAFVWLNQLPAVLDVFGAGILAATAFVRLRPHALVEYVPLATGTALGVVALVLVAIACLGSTTSSGGDDAGHRWLNAWRVAFGPILCAGTLGLAFGAPSLRTLASAPVLKWLSLVSYNAYLWNL
ncbi:MAG: acyltransferase, partial [Candidatus Eremiobacteraeota bacterium]|nr:acyltransferase [Candidatus Eremiobacteraeota bacterium]